MNLPSDTSNGHGTIQEAHSPRAHGAEALPAFLASGNTVSPFEFRALTALDMEAVGVLADSPNRRHPRIERVCPNPDKHSAQNTRAQQYMGAGFDFGEREVSLRNAIESARREGLQQGEQQGRCASRAEMEAEMHAAISQERQRLATAAAAFRIARERYFAEIEQEVVRLALAIAARVLHREAQIDPLLLAGVVRVALEKMADRSGVVLRVAAADGKAWEQVFAAAEASERPIVMADAQLARGECVLETTMGTVELGVRVQLEEIEKGFFDLLNHRPVE